MVWGAIGYNGTIDICVTTESINSEKYISIIESTYLPHHQPGYILMQDNARPHVSRQTLDFMDPNGIQLLDWPDCNVIENLWAIIVQRLYRGGKSNESISQLTCCHQVNMGRFKPKRNTKTGWFFPLKTCWSF